MCVYGVYDVNMYVCMCLPPAQNIQGGGPKPGSASQTLLIPSSLSPDTQGLKGHLRVFVSCCDNVLILKSPLEAQRDGVTPRGGSQSPNCTGGS